MQCPQNYLEWKQLETVPYALVMGGLIYVQTCIRSDISFDADMFGKY